MKTFLIIVLTIIAISLWQHLENNYRRDIVFQVCNTSRISPNINETECGNLQDKWGKEFLCRVNNADPNNFCWVEDK